MFPTALLCASVPLEAFKGEAVYRGWSATAVSLRPEGVREGETGRDQTRTGRASRDGRSPPREHWHGLLSPVPESAHRLLLGQQGCLALARPQTRNDSVLRTRASPEGPPPTQVSAGDLLHSFSRPPWRC